MVVVIELAGDDAVLAIEYNPRSKCSVYLVLLSAYMALSPLCLSRFIIVHN